MSDGEVLVCEQLREGLYESLPDRGGDALVVVQQVAQRARRSLTRQQHWRLKLLVLHRSAVHRIGGEWECGGVGFHNG